MTRKLVCYDCGVACDLSAMRDERLGATSRKLGAEDEARPEGAEGGARSARRRGRDVVTTCARRRRVAQGEGRAAIRFVFAKVGPMAFLSHLDLIRALPRSFRRIDMPIFYSSGFHPKPDMTFSPALSLGVASLSEVLDVKLIVDATSTPTTLAARAHARLAAGPRLQARPRARACTTRASRR